MHVSWRRDICRTGRRAVPLDAASIRLLVAAAVGVLISVIWLTGMLGDSRRVTMLALSAVSILGLGLVLELRKRYAAEEAVLHAKEEADNANRAKSAFLATMSHELRTPLNAIIGFADIIQSEVMGPVGNDKYRSYVTDIHVSGTHLLQVINDILDLTKAEVGMLELYEEIIDVSEVVGAVTRISRPSIDKAGLTITLDIPADLPQLRADERKVRQVLFNLIGNAVKFTPEGGHIAISSRFDPKAGIEIVVADTGIGIAQQDLNRVLEPFVQIDSLLSRHYDGTGLGLPAVKTMMELHDGKLQLSSEPGSGTKAMVIFPAKRAVTGLSAATTQSAA